MTFVVVLLVCYLTTSFSLPLKIPLCGRGPFEEKPYASVSWESKGNMIVFNLSMNTTSWVGIGFQSGPKMVMTHSDFLVSAKDPFTQRWVLTDRYTHGKYEIPNMDRQQDGLILHASQEGKTQHVTVQREMNTHDIQDVILNECRYLYWAYGGTDDYFQPITSDFMKHRRYGVCRSPIFT
jgi:hypothetical protein